MKLISDQRSIVLGAMKVEFFSYGEMSFLCMSIDFFDITFDY